MLTDSKTNGCCGVLDGASENKAAVSVIKAVPVTAKVTAVDDASVAAVSRLTGKEKQLLSRLCNSCAKREYSRSDVVKKALAALDDDIPAAERIADILVNDGFVSDSRYAAAYAREKSSISGWGKVKIRYMLRAKGLSPDDIESGLAELDGAAAESRLRKVVEVKYAALKGDPQCHIKLLRFVIGRGYSYEEAEREIRRCEGRAL